MKFLGDLFVLCGFAFSVLAHGLDREAFTFTKYDLEIRIEPEQQRLAVRGKIALRNDFQSPQKTVALQISSTLHWSSIQFENTPAEFTSQIFTSDIDPTGSLTETILNLPKPIAP